MKGKNGMKRGSGRKEDTLLESSERLMILRRYFDSEANAPNLEILFRFKTIVSIYKKIIKIK